MLSSYAASGTGYEVSWVVRAYVLIEMVPGHARSLVSSLGEKDGVKGATRVTGPYDVIALIESEDVDGISNEVAEKVHSLEGVVRTTTCVCLD